jgi:hypothetical protein
MRRGMVGVLLCGAALLTVAPVSSVSAQGRGVEVPGVGVRIGEPRRERHWDERSRTFLRDPSVREGRGCKTVTVQEETPRGTITRKRTRC